MVEIAASVAASVAAKIAGYLVAPVGRPFIDLWNYKTNLENLKNEVEKLKAMKRSVERLSRVREVTAPHVVIWQKSVDQIIPEAELISEDNLEQESIQCCIGFSFLNLINRYQRSKNAAEKLKEVLKLEQEAAPWLPQTTISTNIPDYPWLRSGDGYEAFDSRSSVLKNIIDALCDPDVNMVGIYGMGGIVEGNQTTRVGCRS
ncbi:hypothetical protein Q3G72_023999 [Acer saccharum]|nr:hypothetical protein Q3G72_023999 [Acer saccharum]